MIRSDFAIYIGFPNGAGNKLGILAAKVENQDFFRHDGAKVRKRREFLKAGSGLLEKQVLSFRNIFVSPFSNARNQYLRKIIDQITQTLTYEN